MVKKIGTSKSKSVKVKLTPEDKRARKVKSDHMRVTRAVFRNAGFDRALEIAEKEINFGGQSGEFDDAFVYQNVIILVEYTTSSTSNVTAHLKAKKIIFGNVLGDTAGFINYLCEKFPIFKDRLGSTFHIDKYIIKIIYCSRYDVESNVKSVVNEPIYMDFPILKYFEKVCGAIRLSSLMEILAFIEVDPVKVAHNGVFTKNAPENKFEGSILPESASGYPTGYKVVSFYADAASLLKRAFVLRREGWRGSFQAYQRMIQPTKIDAIRKKLKSDKQVFVNNLIATLPADVHPVDSGGKTIDIKLLKETSPVKISLPLRPNSIGLIDGQHRLFSYYESREDDAQIAALRNEQNLLVTGIIYPPGTNQSDAERFEATLFLAINSNQTNAPPALRQEIEVILKPYSATAIGKQVIQRLAASGPLAGHIETYFFDKGKLKTTSIVSYGLGPLIKLGGNDSLFKVFDHPDKDSIASGTAPMALEEYLGFSASKIKLFLNAVRANVDQSRWTTDPKIKNRIISVTYVNSFLITMRLIIESGIEIEFDYLKSRLIGIDKFDFTAFHSSQYNRMAERIFDTYFK